MQHVDVKWSPGMDPFLKDIDFSSHEVVKKFIIF